MLGMAVFFLLLLFQLSLSEHSVDIDKHMQYGELRNSLRRSLLRIHYITDCNTTCLLHSALPVCGSDKITYNDECSLKAVSHHNSQSTCAQELHSHIWFDHVGLLRKLVRLANH